jgi:hypothetical protein
MNKYLKKSGPGEPRVFEVKSLAEFIEVSTWVYSDENVLFRGQPKEKDWPLVPSVGRDPEHSRCLLREREILEEFKRESVPYLNSLPANDWQWLALAQHNRLPTRLLDWTKNPLVALWFGVEAPPMEEQPAIVWALHYEETEAIFNTTEQEPPFTISRTYVYFPEHVYRYIQAQSGVFTVHHSEGEEPVSFSPLNNTMSDADLILTKIEIPAQYFSTIRHSLFQIGISPAMLFPGLDGIVGKIRYANTLCADERKAKTSDRTK